MAGHPGAIALSRSPSPGQRGMAAPGAEVNTGYVQFAVDTTDYSQLVWVVAGFRLAVAPILHEVSAGTVLI